MKKIIILFTTLLLLLAALPIIGNKYTQNILESKIADLKTNGIGISNEKSDSSYLNSSKHYEFYVEDMDKFLEYLSHFSTEQLPPYVDAIVDGVLVGADLEYSNFPFMKDVSVDIYPLSISKKMKEGLKKEDAAFSRYIDSFLESKGILYHLNYNIVSEDFNGYIKDIKEKYTFKDSAEISFNLTNALFHGNGKLIAPNLLISTVKNISLDVKKKSESLSVHLNGFNHSSNFESQSTYLTAFGLKAMEIIGVTQANDKIVIKATDIKADISSNTQSNFGEIFTKSSLKNLEILSKEMNFKASGFNYDLSLHNMDKDALEELRIVVSKAQNITSILLEEKLRHSMISLFSKGFKLKVADLSLSSIVLNDTQNLDSVKIQASVDIKADKNLGQKVSYAPMLIVSNIDTDLKIKLSKKIFAYVNQSLPMVGMLKRYAKEEGSNLVYEISFKNGEFKINGKAL